MHDGASVDRPWSQRSHSPSPSIQKFATNIAQRVGAFVGSANSRSTNGLPTEAELEAEAEREREQSRREAEMIIQREAEERRMVEEGVMAMIQKTQDLPPPPPRSQTMSSNPPSPSNSQKEKESWFTAVKNKLTPYEGLTLRGKVEQTYVRAQLVYDGAGAGFDGLKAVGALL